MLDVKKRGSVVEALSRWWQGWTQSSSEFACRAGDEIERLGRDLEMSAEELRRVAQKGPEAAELLLHRMAALGLDQKQVFQSDPGTFRELQRACILCECRRQCARDLARDSGDPMWEDYCPNAATLKMLNAMPWAAQQAT